MTPVNNVPGNYSLENDLRGDSSPVNNVRVDIFIYRPTLWVGEWILLYDTRLNQQVLLSLMLCVSIPVYIWIQCSATEDLSSCNNASLAYADIKQIQTMVSVNLLKLFVRTQRLASCDTTFTQSVFTLA